jgi:transcription elongation factor GreB
MSKAFTKEDVDPPDRSGRVRSPSGLPPGAVNYITAEGATRLKEERARLQRVDPGPTERIAELQQILGSVTIVEAPDEAGEEVAFGAAVTVRDAAGQLTTYRVVGVEETQFYKNAVSWVSPVGRKLLSAGMGHRLALEGTEPVTVVGIEYPKAGEVL